MAVATSGITKRRGADWHHLINPQTGQPAATDLLTATVSAPSATAADIYAKCMVLLGSKEAHLLAPRVKQAILQPASGDIMMFGGT
jgi:thiamine biosynthesis lipoprotein